MWLAGTLINGPDFIEYGFNRLVSRRVNDYNTMPTGILFR